MSKIAVVYTSKYGATKRYAQWIAEALDAPIFESAGFKPSQLDDYDVIVYGGGLYAGGIDGVNLVTKTPCKALVVFTVGLADPQITDYAAILARAFKPEQLAETKVFHLRGGIDYSKLNIIHKGMMAIVKREAAKKAPDKRTSEDAGIVETYGKTVDFSDRATIEPLVEFVRAL
ncbi:MAG: flavodoxin domain-containing protein [Defluviitaleaceae bacterium]|nr:flavodoxin domain-containing protein [Defluviitaleaceae bacterium]